MAYVLIIYLALYSTVATPIQAFATRADCDLVGEAFVRETKEAGRNKVQSFHCIEVRVDQE